MNHLLAWLSAGGVVVVTVALVWPGAPTDEQEADVYDLDTEPLRVQIHRHLMAHPDLTAYEIGRAIGRGSGGVYQSLCRMEKDGEAERFESPRTPTDRRPAIRWRAT